MSESPVPSTPLLQTSHARHLEQISDQEFWRHAAELASIPSRAIPDADGYLVCPFLWPQESSHAPEQTDKSKPQKVLVPLAHLREVIATPARFTYLPASLPWMIGITAWQRRSIAVIDLTAYLAQQPVQQIQGDSFILIAQYDTITVGLATAIIDTVATFPSEHIQPLDQCLAQPHYFSPDAIQGTYADALVLHLPTILTTIVQKLRATR